LNALFFLCGCSGETYRIDYGNVDLAPISGHVTLDGQPSPLRAGVFHDVDMATIILGLTDTNGRYKLIVASITHRKKERNRAIKSSASGRLVEG
jgi:hypothetical protein